MKSLLKLNWSIAVLAALLVSCTEDKDPTPVYPSLKGAFVVCEGYFSSNNGAIGFYNEEVSEGDIFKSVNSRQLGDVVQDFAIVDTLGFVVVNNSQKVEVVRMRDFVSVTTLDDAALSYPRYVKQATEHTLYITNGKFDGEVLVYDFKTLELTGTIAVGKGPEMMEKVGNKMYVANSGGWEVDNTISIIDIEKGEVIKTLEVDQGSVTLKADNDNNIWVYSKGSEMDANWNYTAPKLFKIDTATDEVVKIFNIQKTITTYGSNLMATSPDGYVYYTADATYKLGVDATELPATAWLANVYYGLEVDNETGYVYAMDSNTSEVLVLNPDDADEISKITGTAALPRSVVFNN